MEKTSFELVWNNIVKNQGEVFRTTGRNLEFIYEIVDDNFVCSRTNWNITKNDFLKAYDMWPINNVKEIQNLVMGPSYVLAVLKDKRVII